MKTYKVGPRPVGADITPGCFCCGGEEGLYANASFFVGSHKDGVSVVSLFKHGARLDYRPYEPNWIQVKVGACEKHVVNLEKLLRIVLESREPDGSYPLNEQIIKTSCE